MQDYSQAWQAYRHGLRRNWLVLLLFLPLALLLRALVHNAMIVRIAVSVPGMCWFLGAVAARYQADHFLCPLCGKQFTNGWQPYFGACSRWSCWHCGLPRHATDDRDWKVAQS